MHVYCDFDGTITTRDATDFVLERLASPGWLEIEAQWQRGEMGSAECMRRQIALMGATRAELDRVLDEVEIDEGFSDFVSFCDYSSIPVTIISDGVDYFIRRILGRRKLDVFRVIANRLTISPENAYQLASPWRSPACAAGAGVCKCREVEKETAHRVYVGDGRSDFCVSATPETVFAKGQLAAHCEKTGTPYASYKNFHDVTAGLERLLLETYATEPIKII
ncbi:MAG: MtnX-like HAD-IB family phosphatase [Alphaproteobacteria bacterium]|nr:MtnX-like HAD-IB family phosphatase [Alphaproteobacteria bacterium]MDE2337415.1 MtnX-like HAD-IB family phosphatase [Alphaproteobacteria bacterium]